jgi:hypothetical protein
LNKTCIFPFKVKTFMSKDSEFENSENEVHQVGSKDSGSLNFTLKEQYRKVNVFET